MRRANALTLTGIICTALPGQSAAQTAANEFYSAEEMRAAREALREHMGGQTSGMVFADRLEYQSNDGDPVLLWDGQAWLGGDIDKVWIKTEGEYLTDGDATEEAEVQALYSRAVSPYFDLQVGYRYDVDPGPERHFAVLGAQGLAPYWFEVDAAAFLSDDGDISARLEAEYELFITQKLVLQPRMELDLAVQDVPELGIGSGLSTAEAGLRLRYEIRREFAPYFGVSWCRAFGDTGDFARAGGESVETVSFVAGIRFWY